MDRDKYKFEFESEMEEARRNEVLLAMNAITEELTREFTPEQASALMEAMMLFEHSGLTLDDVAEAIYHSKDKKND